jgi:hypothetical protein
MRRGHVWKLAVATAVLGALVAPVIAFATLPKPRQALIVPYEGMGKLKLGITKAKAFDRWDQADDCTIGRGVATPVPGSPTAAPTSRSRPECSS